MEVLQTVVGKLCVVSIFASAGMIGNHIFSPG